MTRLVLHVGTHKTGTTYLQHLFAENRDRLAERGISFPMLAADRALHPQNHSALVRDIRHGGAVPGDGSTPGQWETIADIVRTERPDTMVLIGEEFCRIRYWQVDQLRSVLEAAGFDEVNVVGYLRRQDSFLVSMYIQWVKSGATGDSFQHVRFRYQDAPRMRYGDLYDVFAAHFGAAAVSLRPYETPQFVGGSLLTDFLDVARLGIVEGDLSAEGIEANASVGATSVGLFRLAFAIAENSGLDSRERRWMFRAVRPITERYAGEDPPFNGWRHRQALHFLEGYDEQNHRVARACLDRAKLFKDRPETIHDRDQIGIEPSSVRSYIAEITDALGL